MNKIHTSALVTKIAGLMQRWLKRLGLCIPTLRVLHAERNQYAHLLQKARCDIEHIQACQSALTKQIEGVSALAGASFPVYLTHGTPSWSAQTVQGAKRICVITMPKAGTYLMAALLKRLGLVNCGVHLDKQEFSDYRQKNIAEIVSQYKEFGHVYPLAQSIRLISEGQFAVGHIPYDDECLECLQGVSIIFMHREIRCSCISMMRWLSRRKQESEVPWKHLNNDVLRTVSFMAEMGQTMVDWFGSIAPWKYHPEVLPVAFESLSQRRLQNDLGQQLANQIGLSFSPEEIYTALLDVIDRPTPTHMASHSVLEGYWSDEAESLFRSFGGLELNRKLGYEQ